MTKQIEEKPTQTVALCLTCNWQGEIRSDPDVSLNDLIEHTRENHPNVELP